MPRPFVAADIRGWEWPGPPPGALLLHGIGNYGRYWDLFADAVGGALRLVAPDARGHGDSPRPATGYAPDDFVRDATAVIDATALDRPIVVGHSMGGFHATALALARPERVRGLVLVDVGPRVEEQGMSRARRLTSGRPDRFADEASALAYLHETSPGYTPAVYENRLRHVFARDERGGLVWRSSKEALARILDESERAAPAVWDQLGDIRRPVLIVRGTRSPSFSAATAAGMLETLDDARMVELDAGHNVALERPAELAAAVLAFASEVGDR